MKYQKVCGKTENDCLLEMRMLYGPNAVPISRKVEQVGGLWGKLRGKKQVVMTVRISEKTKDPVNLKLKH